MAMLYTSNKSCLQRVFVRYFSASGQRVTGYVNYYHPEENFGFVIRDDAPEKEFHFTGADLHVESIPKVRTYAKVEFATLETAYGRCLARDVSAPMGRSLSFRHANLRLPEEQRTLKLSDLAAGGQRFTGVVIHVSEDNKRGYIIPDKLQYQVCTFDMKDLWVTGMQRIPLHAEVEFIVYPRNGKIDKAFQITRSGGGLITSERKYLGGIRRSLGAKYRSTDKLAFIPRDLKRQSGYICDINEDKLCCMICPHDNMFTKIFTHFDDLHIYGHRRPRLYDPVEFTLETNPERGLSKAIHVSGPGGEVIQSIFDNELIGNERRTNQVVADEMHDGFISSLLQKPMTPTEFYGFITPNKAGFERVYFHKYALSCTDSMRCREGSRVQFSATELADGKLQASTVVGYGGVPLTWTRGAMGDFYRGHAVSFSSLQPVPLTPGPLQGFVTNFNPQERTGSIEITSLGVRFQRVAFDSSDVAGQPHALPQGSFVEFEVEEILADAPVKRQAKKIKSVGSQGFDPEIRFKTENIIIHKDDEQAQEV